MRHRNVAPFLLFGFVCRAAAQSPAADAEFFEARVRPVLARSCYSCHGADQQLSKLRVDSREGLVQGGARGPALVAGEPGASLLLKAVRHEGLQMPPGVKLKSTEVAALEEWIRRGAVWPRTRVPATSSTAERYQKLAREHWAFQPVRQASAAAGPHALDAMIAARLQKAGLTAAPAANRRTLMRRLSYILTGLPPTAESVDRFVADTSPGAYDRVVDSLLASHRFGEQWARHWLDLVRYGETRGYEWNYEVVGAWRYRDYLIRAFNADVPYDALIREHIAGDLLEKPRINAAEHINESVIGTAFYRLGEAGHDDCVMFRELALDVVDNQIDTLTKTFQGLTVSCARCHDHKLDPIPTEDYYGLYGILNSSRQVSQTIDTPDAYGQAARLHALKGGVREELASLWIREAAATDRYLLATRQGAAPDRAGLIPARIEAWRAAVASPAADLADPGNPWASIACESGGNPAAFRPTASRVTERYRSEAELRKSHNRETFTPWNDPLAAEGAWRRAGTGLANGVARDGDFLVATAADRAIAGILPAGIYTHLLSDRLNGALRSPDLPKTKKYLSLRVMGGQLGACRTVIDNCAIGEKNKIFENDSLTWVKLDTVAAEQRLPVFVELVTRWDNPRIPDRPGVLKPAQLKWMDQPHSYFGIAGAVLHDANETPREELAHLLPLFDQGAPASWKELAHRYGRVTIGAVERWAADRATPADVRWLDWLLRNGLLTNHPGATPRLRQLLAEYRTIESGLPEPRVVDGVADMSPGREFPVLIGGNAKNPGQPAPRRFLRYLFGDAPFAGQGSGRRELAERIANPANPLTARVMVNRIWSHVFGRGLVPSVDNFGLLGDHPSHPELLDYLAAKFVEDGWSIKKMIRLMVTSETFRQSAAAGERASEIDPQNELLQHYPVRRLEAEPLRDSILAAAGNLNETMYGPSTQPYREQPKDYRRLFSGPLDGDGRRSIYLKVTRMEGPRFLETFDFPIPMTTRGARDVTNVPAQALALLNDPFVIAEAARSAQRLLAQPAASMDSRLTRLFRAALARNPDPAELERFRGLAAELASLHQVPRSELLDSLTVWKDLAHAVFNLKEFVYID